MRLDNFKEIHNVEDKQAKRKVVRYEKRKKKTKKRKI